MEITAYHSIRINELSAVGEARRMATASAMRQHFSSDEAARIAIISTEAATNLFKHARGGEIILSEISENNTRGIGLLAIDRGPGIINLDHAMADGNSSVGTAGSGLGAIRRLSSWFDIYSASGGTALLSLSWAGNLHSLALPTFRTGALCIPHPGFDDCGDGWATHEGNDGLTVLLVDGLGHGHDAAVAAREAVAVFRKSSAITSPVDLLDAIHHGLRHTRGAAGAVARVEGNQVRYCGVGNISASVIEGEDSRHMVSHYGTLGQGKPILREFTYPWRPESLLVLHSDGLSARWALSAYPTLQRHHPLLIAAVLFRDFRRERDDACVLAARSVS